VIFDVVRDFSSRTERGMTESGIWGREYFGCEFGNRLVTNNICVKESVNGVWDVAPSPK
jgi:hypothetical protein